MTKLNITEIKKNTVKQDSTLAPYSTLVLGEIEYSRIAYGIGVAGLGYYTRKQPCIYTTLIVHSLVDGKQSRVEHSTHYHTAIHSTCMYIYTCSYPPLTCETAETRASYSTLIYIHVAVEEALYGYSSLVLYITHSQATVYTWGDRTMCFIQHHASRGTA